MVQEKTTNNWWDVKLTNSRACKFFDKVLLHFCMPRSRAPTKERSTTLIRKLSAKYTQK